MNISDKQCEDYLRDGVVCVRSVIDNDLVEALRIDLDLHLKSPAGMELGGEALRLDTEVSADAHKKSWQAFNGWKYHDGYKSLVFGSALPEVAARLMGSSKVQLLYDHSFTKEAGSPIPVPWHHDVTFWPVSGTQICSAWVALDIVTPESGAVNFVRGSHKWPDRFRPSLELNEQTAQIVNMDLPPAQDYFEVRDANLVSWDMEPGDVLVFSARTLHGSSGNSAPDRARRAISPRFIGDDVRFVAGPHVLTPLIAETPWLSEGDRLRGPEFPLAWAQ